MSAKTAENQGVYSLDHVNEAAVNVLRRMRKAKGYDVEELTNYTGISADRMVTEGYGATRPLIEDEDPSKTEVNRRIEIRVIEEEE